jgi:hypothetical protein
MERNRYTILIGRLSEIFADISPADIRECSLGQKIFSLAYDEEIPCEPEIYTLLYKLIEIVFRLESYQVIVGTKGARNGD